jgi:hypothetical protein
MARTQYRIHTESRWMSQTGNAILAILNKLNSGKQINITSLEVYNNSRAGNMVTVNTQSAVTSPLRLCRVTNISGGDALTAANLDSAAGAWPATVHLLRNAGTSATDFTSGTTIATLGWRKGSMPNWQCHTNQGALGTRSAQGFGTIWSPQNNSSLERVAVAAGESLALYCDVPNANIPVFVEVVLARSGSPTRNYAVSFFANIVSEVVAPFAIVNDIGSGETIYLHQLTVSETGSYDTPYLQVVPVGMVEANALVDPVVKVVPIPTDTAYPALATSIAEVYADVPILPWNVPVEYIAQSSAGSPKGFNYLQTKDFIGPEYMCFFPEAIPFKSSGAGTTVPTSWAGQSMRRNSIKGWQAPISLREGEGMAIVGGAETATGTNAVSMSGWLTLEFGITFTVEDTTLIAITVVDVAQLSIVGARVEVKTISSGAELMNTTTDANGYASATVNYTGTSINVVVHVRKSSPGDTRYINESTLQTITNTGLNLRITLRSDPAA